MATKTASAAQSTTPSIFKVSGPVTRNVSYRLGGTTLSAGDVIQMLKVPVGAVINDITFAISCTAQSYTVGSIGDGNDVDRYFGTQSAVLVMAARMSLGTGFGYEYSAEDTIDVVVGTVTSGTAADAELRLVVQYTNQP